MVSESTAAQSVRPRSAAGARRWDNAVPDHAGVERTQLVIRQIRPRKLHLPSDSAIARCTVNAIHALKQPGEQKLLQALAGGDMQALAAIYDAYRAPVYHLLLVRLGEKEQAEDILVEVFLALVERGRHVTSIRNLRAYLLKIARNKAARVQRRRGDNANNPATLPAVAETPIERKLDAIAVHDALAQLPAEQAEVVVLKIWHEMTFAQIGEVLDISPNTAASRYRYGLEKLRQILGESNDDQ